MRTLPPSGMSPYSHPFSRSIGRMGSEMAEIEDALVEGRPRPPHH